MSSPDAIAKFQPKFSSEEFFAVSVEVFFERPKDLRHELPEVYEQLSKLFRLNPVEWA